MHRYTLLVVLLALGASASAARTINPKALARFDAVYVDCEAKHPEMRGGRDVAYMNLWQANADDKSRGQLDGVRKGAIYASEFERVRRTGAGGASASAARAIDQQCQALRTEVQAAKGRP